MFLKLFVHLVINCFTKTCLVVVTSWPSALSLTLLPFLLLFLTLFTFVFCDANSCPNSVSAVEAQSASEEVQNIDHMFRKNQTHIILSEQFLTPAVGM